MRYAAIACLLGWALATVASAQESSARLLGTITDPTGAVIPGANIMAHNVATGLERKTVSNATGEYLIPGLPIGEYTVTADSSGFKTSTITGLTLQVNQDARVDIRMAVGGAAESIEVQAVSPLW